MKAIQDSWKVFYEEILADMGASKPLVSFPNISQDPTYREAQSIATSYSQGLLWQDEAYEAMLELLDVQRKHETPPKPDDFNVAGLAKNAQEATAAQAEKTASQAAAAQGVTGSVPGGTDQNTTNHDGDKSSTSK
jgi:hypothetical protein